MGNNIIKATFNPIDKLIEIAEENKKLYAALRSAGRQGADVIDSQFLHFIY